MAMMIEVTDAPDLFSAGMRHQVFGGFSPKVFAEILAAVWAGCSKHGAAPSVHPPARSSVISGISRIASTVPQTLTSLIRVDVGKW